MKKLYRVKQYGIICPNGGNRLIGGILIEEGSNTWGKLGLNLNEPLIAERLELVEPDELKKYFK